ncbi:hypothetical protein BDN70DRAFT_373462 [Pholiota conissans]|uniref:Uncharacterized protein n=1 Tax=Pholiota conissans TaxID=109636 RepID=A0A9P6D4T2_9AGAR|nr:hypothetical protein BDN70DRAFT_373462 [Pholiota conissans]
MRVSDRDPLSSPFGVVSGGCGNTSTRNVQSRGGLLRVVGSIVAWREKEVKRGTRCQASVFQY